MRANSAPRMRATSSAADPVAELGEPLLDLAPEHQPVGDRRRHRDRAEPGDVLLADLAGDPAGLDEADLQAVTGLAEAGEHRSGRLGTARRRGKRKCATTAGGGHLGPL